jgi:prepilin-type processing-associated H-X9-DG protein
MLPGIGSDYFQTLEKYRHGRRLGSNYLFLDLHVDRNEPQEIKGSIDPWDIPSLPAVP